MCGAIPPLPQYALVAWLKHMNPCRHFDRIRWTGRGWGSFYYKACGGHNSMFRTAFEPLIPVFERSKILTRRRQRRHWHHQVVHCLRCTSYIYRVGILLLFRLADVILHFQLLFVALSPILVTIRIQL